MKLSTGYATCLILASALTFEVAHAIDADIRAGRSEIAGVVLKVADLDKSVAYYKMIGLQHMGYLGEQPKRIAVFNVIQSRAKFMGGLALYETNEPVDVNGGFVRAFLVAKDVVAICMQLAEVNMPCTSQPKVVSQDGNATVAFAKDPDGYVLELMQLPR
jgi:hypothetical protein